MPSSKRGARQAAAILCLLAGIVASGTAGAADKDPAKAAKEQVRKLMEQKRALEMEKNQLQEEKNAMAGKLEQAEAEAARKKALENGLAESQRRLRAVNDQADKLKAEVAELKGKVAAGEAELQKITAQFQAEQKGRSQSDKELATCTARNDALYRQGRDIIQAFGRGGECDAVGRGEPIFGLGRVERENTLEAMRDGIDEQRYRGTVRN